MIALSMIQHQQPTDERICECTDRCEYHVSRIRLIRKLRLQFGYETLKDIDHYQNSLTDLQSELRTLMAGVLLPSSR